MMASVETVELRTDQNDEGSGNFTGEDDKGEAVAKGILHASDGGNNVGSTWPRCDKNDTGSARDTSATFSHATRALSMSRDNVGGVEGRVRWHCWDIQRCACQTQCLSIISWKISPLVLSMKEWSRFKEGLVRDVITRSGRSL
jgi:hypothetical protein